MAILDAHGRVVQHPAVWSTHPGTMPPEPIRLVVLAVGQHARFVLASTDVTPSRGCRAPYSGRTLQVFPPNQTTALRAPYHGSFCNLTVGPVHRLPTQVARMCTGLGGEHRAMPRAFATRRRDPPGGPVAAAGATATGSVHGKSIGIGHAVDDDREGEIMSDEPK